MPSQVRTDKCDGSKDLPTLKDGGKPVRSSKWQIMINGESYKWTVAEAAKKVLGMDRIEERVFIVKLVNDKNRIAGAVKFTDRAQYAQVQESHCNGHFEPRQLTVGEYRKDQGIEEYDEHGRGWRQLVLKKKSAGPTVGSPSQRSLQLFFMACYDVDQFREFVKSPSFQGVYDIPTEEQAKWDDDIAMMEFGFQLIRQVLFNEMTIPMRADAMERRLARKKEREAELDKIVAKLPTEEFVKPIPEEEKYDKYKFSDS